MAVSVETRPAPAEAMAVSDKRTPWPTGPDCSARGRRRGLAGQRADAPSHTSVHPAPLVWRAPEGPAAVPVGAGGTCRGAGGRRRDLPRCRWAAAGPGQALSRRTQPHASDPAPLAWRAPEGPEGTGGLRDRPLRAVGSRVAISRAAGPGGARNTSGATSNNMQRQRRAGGRARRRPEHQRSTPSSPSQQAGKPPLTLRRRAPGGPYS